MGPARPRNLVDPSRPFVTSSPEAWLDIKDHFTAMNFQYISTHNAFENCSGHILIIGVWCLVCVLTIFDSKILKQKALLHGMNVTMIRTKNVV